MLQITEVNCRDLIRKTTGTGHDWIGELNHLDSPYRVNNSSCNLSIQGFYNDDESLPVFFVPEEFQHSVICSDGNLGVQLANYTPNTDLVYASDSNFGTCFPPVVVIEPTTPTTAAPTTPTTVAPTTPTTTTNETATFQPQPEFSGSGLSSGSGLIPLPSAKTPRLNIGVAVGTAGAITVAGVTGTVAASIIGKKVYDNHHKGKIDIETDKSQSKTKPEIELRDQI